MSGHSGRVLACGTIVVFSLVWSSAFIAGKIAVPDYHAFTTLCLRFALSVLLLGLVCLCRPHSFGGKKLARTGLLLGFVNNALYLGLTFSALRFISAGWVVIITACSPFMTMALAACMGLERLSATRLAGMLVGFSGVVVITGVESGLAPGAGAGLALALAGAFAFSFGTVLFRGRAEGMPIVPLNFWQSLSGLVFLLPLAALFEGWPASASLAGALAIGWLVLVTILGMGLWMALIRMWGAGTAASFHLLNPVSGLLLSFLILGLDPTLRDGAGALLVGAGLLLTLRKDGKKTTAR